MDELQQKLERLRAGLQLLGSVVVAFSGGVDSALLAWVANDTLGRERCRVVTAVSPSLAPEEEHDCRAIAAEWDLDWRAVLTDELTNASYVANEADRCFHCKTALMDAAGSLGGDATVVLGVNVDDLGEHRPGQHAAAERGARFPLVEAGLTKADVRALSRWLGLRTWDKPAAACLASRLPYGTPVTVGTLSAVAAAESALRTLGFRQVRVRHYGDLARIEVEIDALAAVMDRRDDIVAAVHGAGYRYVTLDLEGFRSGNLNLAISAAEERR